MIPDNIKESLTAYVEQRRQPGDFLRSVLANDLSGACGRADHKNKLVLCDIVQYIFNDIPSICWGSYEKVEAWLNPPTEQDVLDRTFAQR